MAFAVQGKVPSSSFHSQHYGRKEARLFQKAGLLAEDLCTFCFSTSTVR